MLVWVEQAPLLLAIGTADVDVPPEMVIDFYRDCLTERGLLPRHFIRRQLAREREGAETDWHARERNRCIYVGVLEC